jgi:hypothetical protein
LLSFGFGAEDFFSFFFMEPSSECSNFFWRRSARATPTSVIIWMANYFWVLENLDGYGYHSPLQPVFSNKYFQLG